MIVRLPRARTLGVLLTLLALGLLPAHGFLHDHHDSHGACGQAERGTRVGAPPIDSEGPCTLCHQLSSGVALAGRTHAEGPDSRLAWLAGESDVDRRDVLRARTSVRGPPNT